MPAPAHKAGPGAHPGPPMPQLHILDLEAAINWWRDRSTAQPGDALDAPLQALAEVYGRMVFERLSSVDPGALPSAALDAWLAWYATTPDSPCIAICSTAQGDPLCKGCGRSFDEVQHWPALDPFEKRAVWRRISLEASAWRFNRYAERG